MITKAYVETHWKHFITYYLLTKQNQKTQGLFQYPIRRLIVRSREVSINLYLKLSDRSKIWQATLQQLACQMSKRCDDLNYQSRGFETWRDLTIRRHIGYWNGAHRSIQTRQNIDLITKQLQGADTEVYLLNYCVGMISIDLVNMKQVLKYKLTSLQWDFI